MLLAGILRTVRATRRALLGFESLAETRSARSGPANRCYAPGAWPRPSDAACQRSASSATRFYEPWLADALQPLASCSLSRASGSVRSRNTGRGSTASCTGLDVLNVARAAQRAMFGYARSARYLAPDLSRRLFLTLCFLSCPRLKDSLEPLARSQIGDHILCSSLGHESSKTRRICFGAHKLLTQSSNTFWGARPTPGD